MPSNENNNGGRAGSLEVGTEELPQSLTNRLTAPFRRRGSLTPLEWKSESITKIWGFHQTTGSSSTKWLNRLDRLSTFFDEYEKSLLALETLTVKNQKPRPDEGATCHSQRSEGLAPDRMKTHSSLRYSSDRSSHLREHHALLLLFIQILRLNPDVPRSVLKLRIADLLHDQSQVPGYVMSNITLDPISNVSDVSPGHVTSFRIPEDTKRQDFQLLSKDKVGLFDSTLALVTKATFGISIHDKPQFREGDLQIKQSVCLWSEEMTLRELVVREFPPNIQVDQLSGRFKERLVSLRSLVQHADLEVVWTKHLPDHLLLSYSEHSKTLNVFDLPSLLEVSYESWKETDSHYGGIPNSCCNMKDQMFGFSADFMLETLQTYSLLIPHRDARWVRKAFLSSSSASWYRFLTPWRRTYQQAADQRLTEVFNLWQQNSGVGSRLTTYSQMFRRFPHWGLRIQSLLEEAEDPTPMSWTGRWAERRKGPRHSFWVTFIAFLAATIFGVVATAFGVAQLWVAWCDWQDGAPKLCKPRTSAKDESRT